MLIYVAFKMRKKVTRKVSHPVYDARSSSCSIIGREDRDTEVDMTYEHIASYDTMQEANIDMARGDLGHISARVLTVIP